MSSNYRSQKARAMPKRFTESPLDVYDVAEWDPIDFLLQEEEIEDTLDEDFIFELGAASRELLIKSGIEDLPNRDAKVSGREVGDDRVDYSRDPSKLSTSMVVQEKVMYMVTSKFDSFISKWIWNFCETSSTIPTTKENSFDYCRKTNRFDRLGFVDSPPMRIILDVSKGDRSHSSTTPGKASMLGGRMRTPRSEFMSTLQLASYLQDGMLRTSRSSEPKYLPQIMGGSGAPALFNSAENLYLYTHAYKGGDYQRVYGTATRELQQCLNLLERDQASMPVLCLRLRDKQEYLHGTYDEKVFIPTLSSMDAFAGRLPPPLIKASGGANLFTSYENRLLRTKHLLTRTMAIREYEYSTRIRAQLLERIPVPITDSMVKTAKAVGRARFGNALNANSAFSNLLKRDATIQDVKALTNENFVIVNTGVTEFSKWDAQWLFSGGKTERFSIEDLTSSEDLYIRTEVSEEETFKVGGIDLYPIFGKGPKHVETRNQVGLYQINSSMSEWAENLLQRLASRRTPENPTLFRDVAAREFALDPEWVNDDTTIIARCLSDTKNLHYRSARVILVSDDRRLATQMSQTCNVQVMRMKPMDYILWCIRQDLDYQEPLGKVEHVSAFVNLRYRRDPIRNVYVDTGSIAAACANLQQEGDWASGPRIVKRTLLRTGTINGHRFSNFTLEQTNVPLRLETTLHEPVLGPKRYRLGTIPNEILTGRMDPQKQTVPSSSSRSNSDSWR